MSNQMKISFLISFLLLATVLHEAQGMNRKLLIKTTDTTSTPIASSSSSKMLNVEEKTTDTKPNGKTSSSTTNTAEKEGGKKEKLSVKSSLVPEHREAVQEHYPDVLDIAGMDYSPARRKSPIHN